MKKLALTIFLLIILMTTNVFAATEVTMEIIENNICTINLNKNCSFEKKIIDSDLKNHQVTLQLKITNNAELIFPSGELMLVIDSSNSMNKIIEGETTRKDLVLNSANKLVESLLKVNPTSLKIGVVTFSTGNEKNNEGFVITGTEADAQKVCDFTNDLDVLTQKISAIEGTGQYTNLDAGLKLAKSQFSADNNNKYLIILTDGLPNLAVGKNDLVTYDGLTEIIVQTKTTLKSFVNTNVITILTGIDNEEATFRTDGTNTYTYGQVITEVFGSAETPTKGKFYKINDTEIEQTITQTITKEIYQDLSPINNSFENITILDYLPKYITDNFNVTLHNESNVEKSTIITDNENKQYISWKIDKLSAGESKTVKYTISLKDKFDETIIGQILDTNEKVDITYKDFDGTDKLVTSNVTPRIKLTAVSQPEPPKDETKAPVSIPKAGSPIFTLSFVLVIGLSVFFGYKSKKIK